MTSKKKGSEVRYPWVLLIILAIFLVVIWAVRENAKNFYYHQAYLLTVSTENFDRVEFEKSGEDFVLIEADEIALQSDGILEIYNGEVIYSDSKSGTVYFPLIIDRYAKKQVKHTTIYLKRYHLDKDGNYTSVYDYQIYSKQADGKYKLVQSGTTSE